MFIFLNRHKIIIILVCLCAISLVLSWRAVRSSHTDEPTSRLLEDSLSTSVAPTHFLSSAVNSISAKFAYVGSFFITMFQKPVEKERFQALENKVGDLKRQLDLQMDRNRRLEEQYEVYANLTGPEDPEPDVAFRLLPAKVIAVEPTDWFRYITIDRGTRDGIKVDMGVITRSDLTDDIPHLTGAVVGRVSEVHRRSAKVQLITDRLSVVAVTIESLGDLVLLAGQPDTESCAINEMPSTAYERLSIGDAVIVDERSAIFPAGMLIGEISHIEKGTHFCSIEVQPAFRFRQVREVIVILNTR